MADLVGKLAGCIFAAILALASLVVFFGETEPGQWLARQVLPVSWSDPHG